MIGIGFAELIVITLVLIIFVKPEDLPKVLRTIGRNYAKAKKLYNELILVKDKVLKDIEEAANVLEDPSKIVTKNLTEPLKNAVNDAQNALMSDVPAPPETPKVHEAPKSLEIPKTPELPRSVNAPELPRSVNAPEVAKLPEAKEAPGEHPEKKEEKTPA